MQEALKNPHYKNIWEKVIMNRHPEAKSLEEALEMEEKHKLHCEVLFRYEDITEIINIEKRNLINVKILEQAQKNSVAEFKTLGRPITLEDIFIVSTKKDNEYYRLCIIDIWCEKEPYTAGFDGFFQFLNWQLTKPLHEQTPETWEKISNLI